MTFPFSGSLSLVCPLCHSTEIQLIRLMKVEEVVETWDRMLGIDVKAQFQGAKTIELHECRRCQLQFFGPGRMEGSSQLYAELERFDWYYMPRKWEHEIALRDLQKGDRVLEVGCGRGDFVERLVEKRMDASGIELNPSAVSYARMLERPVYQRNLKDLVEESRKFDAICGFQILEHISDPAEFMQQCINLLKPCGRLLICVPNNDGFIRLDQNTLLNDPPHHVTRWSRRVFEHVPKYFPLRLRKIHYEPLASYHLDWYASLHLSQLPKIRFLTGLAQKGTQKMLLPAMRRTRLYRFLRGHSIYVRFEKINK